MGLFDKKYCSICGEKIGLLGNRKLDDGNLCKECAGRLSPFFSERRHSTVDQIREQLEYREENRAKVAAFHVTRTLGSRTKVLLDEDKGVFMVTKSKRYEEENPDVIPISDVTGCEIKIDENRTEVYQKNDEGQTVSYNPRRYRYGYNIDVEIYVNHPYFSEISFRMNDWEINVGEPGTSFMGVQKKPMPEYNLEFRHCMERAEEIRAALAGARQEIREQMAAPKQKTVCKACGAPTKPDANGCCEYCGTPLT